VVSYSIPLCETAPKQPVVVKSVRLTELESETPITIAEKGCEGVGANEPGAQPGHVCLFQASDPGSLESQWKNAKFAQMEDQSAIVDENSSFQGVRAVFRTVGWNSSATGTIAAGGAYLVAGGSWAATAP
jgi:hypothetical protein